MNKRDFNNDEFFQNLVDEVNEIMSDLNPKGIIRIPEIIITKLGYYNRQNLEEKLLYKVYTKVARMMGIDFKAIADKMKDRIEIVKEG